MLRPFRVCVRDLQDLLDSNLDRMQEQEQELQRLRQELAKARRGPRRGDGGAGGAGAGRSLPSDVRKIKVHMCAGCASNETSLCCVYCCDRCTFKSMTGTTLCQVELVLWIVLFCAVCSFSRASLPAALVLRVYKPSCVCLHFRNETKRNNAQ